MSTSSRTLGPASLAAQCSNTTNTGAQLAGPVSTVQVAAKEQPMSLHVSDVKARRHVHGSWIAGNLAQLDELQVELHARSPPYDSPTRRAMKRIANAQFFHPDSDVVPQLPPDGSSVPAGMGAPDAGGDWPKHAASDTVVDHMTSNPPGVKTSVARHHSDTPVQNGDGLVASQQSGENSCPVAAEQTFTVTKVWHWNEQASKILRYDTTQFAKSVVDNHDR
jgi:hypothetical protein